MTTVIYPQTIQNILEMVEEYEGADLWSDVLNGCTTQRDRDLTSTLCPVDCADFVVMDGKDLFLFVCNDREWDVMHMGQPIYYVEPEMVGGDSVDFDEFVEELEYQLKGVEIVRGSALKNVKSEFVQGYKRVLDRAVCIALEV